MRNRTMPLGLLAALALAPAVAVAQQPPAPPTPPPAPAAEDPARRPTDAHAENLERAEAVATSRFIEAFQIADWEKAETYFRELAETWPAYRVESSWVYRFCVVLSKRGTESKKTEAIEQLQALLERDPENVNALYLLAQLKAQTDRAAAREEAKLLLLTAARQGFYTLREVMGKDETWKFLRNDPKFILSAMKASQEFTLVNGSGRNPFELPPRFVIPPSQRPDDPGLPADPKKLAELDAKVEAIFADIERLLREDKVDEIVAKFADLDRLMRDYKAAGRERVAKRLEEWGRRADEWKEVRIAITLQKFLNEGNELLQAMVKAISGERFDEVFDKFAQLQKLAATMQKEDREEYQRNASALRLRGAALQAEAKKLKRIKELNLVVKGIVVDPRPEGHNRAIIVFDDPDKRGRIYEENDEIRNREDRRVEGLRVVRIAEGSIKFRYEETEFVRLLDSKAP